MPLYPKINAIPVHVGVVEQTVVAAFSTRGEEQTLLVFENLSATETFSGYAWSSPNGQTQWVQETNDEFVALGPGVTRRMLLPADRVWIRVLGAFLGAPDDLRVSVFQLYTW